MIPIQEIKNALKDIDQKILQCEEYRLVTTYEIKLIDERALFQTQLDTLEGEQLQEQQKGN